MYSELFYSGWGMWKNKKRSKKLEAMHPRVGLGKKRKKSAT